jgi:hypothetical protein
LEEVPAADAVVRLALRAWDRALQEAVEAAHDRIAGGEERDEGFLERLERAPRREVRGG